MLLPGYNYHITVDDRQTFKRNFGFEFTGDGWYLDKADSLYAFEQRSGIKCFVYNGRDPREEYLSFVTDTVRTGSPEPELPGILTPVNLYRLARHVFKALRDFPNPVASEYVKKIKDGPEAWEVALKDAVDSDPALPDYDDLPWSMLEYIIHYYGDAFDAARKSEGGEELPPGTGVATD